MKNHWKTSVGKFETLKTPQAQKGTQRQSHWARIIIIGLGFDLLASFPHSILQSLHFRNYLRFGLLGKVIVEGKMTNENSEIDELNFDIIDEAWRSVRTRNLYENSNEDVNIKSLASLFSLLEKLNELPADSDPTYILESSNLSSLNKQHILHLWQSRKEEGVKWGIDVIVGNSNIKKSLHPKIWLLIDGKEIEMNLEAFAKLRFQVSRALSRIL